MPLGNSQSSSKRMLACVALMTLLPVAANADTLATFDWVAFQNGGTGSGPGDLVLRLPGTIAGPGFDVAFANTTPAKNAVAGFSYTFSNGDTLTLANLMASNSSLQMNPIAWETTNTITPAGAPTGVYLGTNFSFGGFATVGGILTPFQLASSGGMVTLGAGDAQLRITDTGYWKLDSLTPVPLPAAAWLLITGFAGFLGLGRRRAQFGQLLNRVPSF